MDYSDDPVYSAGILDSWLWAEGHGAQPDRYLVRLDAPRCLVRVTPPLTDRAALLDPIVVLGLDDWEFSVAMWFDDVPTAEVHQALLEEAARVLAAWGE